MAFTRPSWVTNTIQTLADRVIGQATNTKVAFDKAASDIKTFFGSFIDELESTTTGSSGADKIGNTALKAGGSTNVGEQLRELKTEVGSKLNSEDTKIYTQEEKNKLATVQQNANNYSLPTASGSVLGGIKIGAGLEILPDGTVNGTSAPAPDLSAREQIAQEITDRQNADNTLSQQLTSHSGDKANPHSVTASQVGLGNVSNVAQMPISGGTFTGIATAQNNTSYTTKQMRNITLSTASASGGGNGDVWFKYV